MTPPDDETAIRHWCCGYVADNRRLDPATIRPEADFTELGFDSAELLFMVSAAEDRFGVDLASDSTIEHPSPAAFARHVAAELAARGRRA